MKNQRHYPSLSGIYIEFFQKFDVLALVIVVVVGLTNPLVHIPADPVPTTIYLLFMAVLAGDFWLTRTQRLPRPLYAVLPYATALFLLYHIYLVTPATGIWMLAVTPIFFARLNVVHAQIFSYGVFCLCAWTQYKIWDAESLSIERTLGIGFLLTSCLAFINQKFAALFKELDQRQTDLETSLSAMSNGLLVVDKSQKIKLFNPQAAKLLNLPKEWLNTHPTLAEVVQFQTLRGDFGRHFELVVPNSRPYVQSLGVRIDDTVPEKYKRKTIDGLHLEIESWITGNGDLVRSYKDVTEYETVNQQLSKVLEEYSRLRSQENEKSREKMVEAMSRLSMFRDNETGQHIERTQLYVKILAEYLAAHKVFGELLDTAYIKMLVKATPMHDLGKIGIPDHILMKPGQHTAEETLIMKTHAAIGEATLLAAASDGESDTSLLKVASKIAGGHHENWDGSGYPRGLVGEAIPLPARLMAIADVYDALTTPRIYKRAWTHEEATKEILQLAGIKFDPRVADAFVQCLDQFAEVAHKLRDKDPA
jgi:response regulator RpfG family c-di-GMP phosphodiesterase